MWLNSDFINLAFTKEEQEAILSVKISTPNYKGNNGGMDTQDKVWILSRDEANQYFANDSERQTTPTAYAFMQGVGMSNDHFINGIGCCWWGLRSPGDDAHRASRVFEDGSVGSGLVAGGSVAVRPSLWLKIDFNQ